MMGKDILRDITNFIFVEDEPAQADVIFIPGGSYPEPAERAAELYRAGFTRLMLPSGKHSVKLGEFAGVKDRADIYTGPYETEWEFMADVLVKCGVPREAVLREDHAVYTQQNANFSRAVLERSGVCVRNGIICCKAFHARRALMYYAAAFPEASLLVCPVVTRGISRSNWFDSADGVKTVLGELSRCGNQFTGREIDVFAGVRAGSSLLEKERLDVGV